MIEKFYTARDGAQISVLYFASENVNAPLIFEIHGGGYFAGHHYDDIPLCTEIGELLDCNVASVEYRYAPEVTFPVAAYDCADALSGLICDSSLDFDVQRSVRRSAQLPLAGRNRPQASVCVRRYAISLYAAYGA